jgi:asparagine synthase (glutamine-hydrolysing)
MARHVAGPINSFSILFDDPDYSEESSIGRVARLFATNHAQTVITAGEFVDVWPEAVRSRAAPVSEPSDIPILVLSRLAGRSVKMVLTGEGADEFLAGYPKHSAERFIDGYHRLIPGPVHNALVAPLVENLPFLSRRLRVFAKALRERNPVDRVRLWFGDVDHAELRALLGRDVNAAPVNQFPHMIATRSAVRRTMYFDQTSWLPECSLERNDRMMMAATVEGRMPFMDTELAALTARFSDRILFHHFSGKAILRRAMRGQLPAEIIDRRKNGFTVPVHRWFRRDQSAILKDLLGSQASETRRMLMSAALDRLIADHLSGVSDNSRALWSLCNLEMFIREFRPAL